MRHAGISGDPGLYAATADHAEIPDHQGVGRNLRAAGSAGDRVDLGGRYFCSDRQSADAHRPDARAGAEHAAGARRRRAGLYAYIRSAGLYAHVRSAAQLDAGATAQFDVRSAAQSDAGSAAVGSGRCLERGARSAAAGL